MVRRGARKRDGHASRAVSGDFVKSRRYLGDLYLASEWSSNAREVPKRTDLSSGKSMDFPATRYL